MADLELDNTSSLDFSSPINNDDSGSDWSMEVNVGSDPSVSSDSSDEFSQDSDYMAKFNDDTE